MPRVKPKTLRPVHPNQGIQAAYRQRLAKLVRDMADSTEYWLAACYKQNEPRVSEIAQDASPAQELRGTVSWLRRRWLKAFNEAAPKLADYFATAIEDRSSKALRKILRDGGISVKFQMTPAQKDVLQATINQNVALIRSIPSEYFTQIEGYVMRSVQTGRDLQQLTRDLKREYGVTNRRAALIARDQNNKATAALTRARQVELGLYQAVWLHSGAGKEPRPKHVKASGTVFDVRKGLPIGDKGQYVLPGEEINCRCVSRTVVPGFT